MIDKESWVQLVAASIMGQRANPNNDFRGNCNPVKIAVRDADAAIEAIEERFPRAKTRYTDEQKKQDEFAKRIEQEVERNGKVQQL